MVCGLSPRAEKARREAAGRDRSYWPRLARTSEKAVVQRPRICAGKYRRLFAQGVAATLPRFRFNSRRDWWEAPLVELQVAYDELGPRVNLSEGAAEYLGLEV